MALLTGHRRIPPYGMASGGPDALGSNHVEGADGSVTRLDGVDAVDVGPGEVLVMSTPAAELSSPAGGNLSPSGD
ncbi:hypothetical protein ACFWDI_29680 [Streptomyces sp. NPDC060064]|uniref:hypothetical protein n=1 Tax=Streptomyces sp. NPDC060064 TaxID=3347049 RepID=UPI0036CEFC55